MRRCVDLTNGQPSQWSAVIDPLSHRKGSVEGVMGNIDSTLVLDEAVVRTES